MVMDSGGFDLWAQGYDADVGLADESKEQWGFLQPAAS